MTKQRMLAVLNRLKYASGKGCPTDDRSIIRYAQECGDKNEVTAAECRKVLNMSVREVFLLGQTTKV